MFLSHKKSMSFFLKQNVTCMQLSFPMVLAPLLSIAIMEHAMQHFKNRKFFILSFIFSMSLGLTACNDSNDDTSSSKPSPAKLNCAP